MHREQQDTEAEEVEDFQPIDKLQQLGINAGEQTCNFVMRGRAPKMSCC